MGEQAHRRQRVRHVHTPLPHDRVPALAGTSVRVVAGGPGSRGLPGFGFLHELRAGRSGVIRPGTARRTYPSGLPISSKYWRVTLNTIGASNSSPTRLGTAIRPLRVSARFHTRSTFTLAKASAAATHSPR